MKFLLYQIIVIGLVWGGMLLFWNDLYDQGIIIFYIVTSWLLFLIVLFVKEWVKSKKNPTEEE